MARQLSALQMCWLCLVVSAGYVVVGIAAEIALGTFKPLSADYRFAGTLHPNGQGASCALLCLAAICLLKHTQEGRPVLYALIVCGVALMLLTRSRTSCVALVAGLLALVCVRPSRQTVAGALGLAWLGVAGVLAALLSGIDAIEELPRILLLGRAEHVTTLTGRTELWEELLYYVGERPLLGYGYGSFWSVDHIDYLSTTLYWDLSSAHSVYLEMTLGVGLIGGLALVLMAAVGVWRAARQYRLTSDGGDALVFALLVYGVFDGIAESGFTAPSFMTVVAGYGLCQLAFFAREPEAGSQRSEVRDQRSEVRGQKSEAVLLTSDL
jgi:O-antigen ligase